MSPSFQPRTRPFRLALIGVIVALCTTSASAETDLKELARSLKAMRRAAHRARPEVGPRAA